MEEYIFPNSQVVDLINIWKTSNKKNEIENIIINNVSFLIYTKIKPYKKEIYYDDLLQEGKIALIRAIKDFDCSRGNNFFTLASWYLSNHIKAFLKNLFKEVACENIGQFVKNNEKTPHDYCEKVENDGLIKKAILSLNDLEKSVLVMRYGFFDSEEYTLNEIGKIFSMSKQYVEQVEKKAVKKVQKKICKELGEWA